ncbi:hypothetical protein ACB092_07G200000 [Castanea dentata]
MGCSNSKVDDLPAVSLCRERLTFLDQAIHYRYALAQSHIAYIHSLKSVGHSLHNFIHQQDPSHLSSSSPIPGSPKKPDPDPKHAHHHHHQAQAHALNHDSHSGHLDFHSDSDDDDGGSDLSLHDDDDHHLHWGNSTPNLHPIDYPDPGQDPDQGYGHGGGGGGGFSMNFMKNKATPPSVVFEQRPPNPETVYMGESSNSGYAYPYYGNSYGNSSATPYSNYGYGYPNSNPNPNPNFNNSNGYYANSPNYGGGAAAVGSTSNSKPPPPPPSPPRASAWDFLNPFESYDKYYSASSPAVAYTPSRDSKVREEEGIPELEDEESYYHRREVVKEVHGDQKFVKGGDNGGRGNHSKAVVVDEDEDDDEVDGVHDHEASTSLYEARPGGENDGAEYEVHVVEKKVVGNEDEEGRSRYKGLNVFQVAREIEVLFERASEFGNEVAKLLEVGKFPYNRKNSVYQVSSKMLHVVTPSVSVVSSHPSTSKGAEPSASAGLPQRDADEDVVTFGSRNLSSTLQKLYLWEKKLYNEVKAEEKMRVVHDRKVSKLKRLDEKGAEAQKVDTTRIFIRGLSTKIRMAIKVVDGISVKISTIRDEELLPQLNELIKGLTGMWKSMLECHRSQCQAIREAKGLGSIGPGKKLSDSHIKATLELEHELIRWTDTFSSWVNDQKGYVRALNNWLLKCLYDEPEETEDGPAPFSPSRIGAPPVFVICNRWSQAMDRISEKEVVACMRVFTISVLQIWEQDKNEIRQRMMVNKDLERKVKNLDREDQKIQKEIQALDKKMIMITQDGNIHTDEQIVYPSDTSNRSLQASLQRIFEAMEKFMDESMKAYQELLPLGE